MRPQVAVGGLANSLEHPATAGVGVAGVVWQTAAPLIVKASRFVAGSAARNEQR